MATSAARLPTIRSWRFSRSQRWPAADDADPGQRRASRRRRNQVRDRLDRVWHVGLPPMVRRQVRQGNAGARLAKAHAMVGVSTNVITAVTVTDSTGNDSPELPSL